MGRHTSDAQPPLLQTVPARSAPELDGTPRAVGRHRAASADELPTEPVVGPTDRLPRRGVSRAPARRRRLRIVLAGFVLALVAVFGGGVFLADRSTGTARTADSPAPNPDGRYGKPPSPLGSTFYVNFADIDPASWPDAYSMREFTLGELTEEPAVRNGVLTQGDAISRTAARYFERVFDQPVHRIGVDVTFPQLWSGDSVVALLVSDGPAPDFVTTAARPNTGMHLVLTNKEWELGVYPSDQSLDIIAHGVFDTSKLTRALLRYEVTLSGDQATIMLPDGLSRTVSDERIRKFAGNYAVWELFQRSPGTGSAQIRAIWAQ